MLLPPLDPAREAQRVPRPRAPSSTDASTSAGALALGSDVRVFAIVGHRGVRPHMRFIASRVILPSWGTGAGRVCSGASQPTWRSDDERPFGPRDPLLASEQSRPPRAAGLFPLKEGGAVDNAPPCHFERSSCFAHAQLGETFPPHHRAAALSSRVLAVASRFSTHLSRRKLNQRHTPARGNTIPLPPVRGGIRVEIGRVPQRPKRCRRCFQRAAAPARCPGA